jgi:hypothetical protein
MPDLIHTISALQPGDTCDLPITGEVNSMRSNINYHKGSKVIVARTMSGVLRLWCLHPARQVPPLRIPPRLLRATVGAMLDRVPLHQGVHIPSVSRDDTGEPIPGKLLSVYVRHLQGDRRYKTQTTAKGAFTLWRYI